jgi:hypothetical protein
MSDFSTEPVAKAVGYVGSVFLIVIIDIIDYIIDIDYR